MPISEDLIMRGFVERNIPFCEAFLCVNSNQSKSEVLLWECMPEKCKTKLIGFMSLLFLLSMLTTIFNAAVLIINLSPSTRRVFGRNATMRNYSNYVISMSITDLLIGVVVLPLAIAFFSIEMFSLREAKYFQNAVTANPMTNTTSQGNISTFSRSSSLTNSQLKVSETPFPANNEKQELENFVSGSEYESSGTLLQCLGFFTQFCVFVSMYTLTAASVDRFYVSRNAACNPSIHLSSSSLKSFKAGLTCGSHSFYPSLRPSRSGVTVVMVWLLGLLLSWLPMGFLNDHGYHQFGHMFVLISFNNYTLTLIWYIITLVIPLLLTWLFSGLLCLVLWRRKRRLRKFSKSLQKQETSDRRTDEKEYDSSCAWTNRYSTTESPILDQGNTDVSCHSDQAVKKEESQNTDEAISESDTTKDTSPLQRPSSLTLLSTPPQRKRPNSFDVFISSQKHKKEDRLPGTSASSRNNLKFNHTNELLKSHSFQNVQEISMAKKTLLKVSWDAVSCQESSSDEAAVKPASPAQTRRNGCHQLPLRPIRFAESPSSPVGPPKCDIVRNPYSRTRRRSSIFRAKEFMMSNSFESNVAKSLLAVVVALSFSILPILFTFPELIRHENNSKLCSTNTSLVVISIVVLLSNSLWNCLIYGARTRYFQTRLRRTCGKAFYCSQYRSSLSKQLSQIFSTKTSVCNNDSKL